jgi:hypothetical protein
MDIFATKADLLNAYLHPSPANSAPMTYKKEYIFISTATSTFNRFNGINDFTLSLNRPLRNVVKTDLVQYKVAAGAGTYLCIQSSALGNNMLTSGTSPAFWRVIETTGSSPLTNLSRVDTFFDAPRDLYDIDIRITDESGSPAAIASAMLVVEIVRVVIDSAGQTLS